MGAETNDLLRWELTGPDDWRAERGNVSLLVWSRRDRAREIRDPPEAVARIIHLHLRRVTIRFDKRIVRRSSRVNVPQHALLTEVMRAPVFLAFHARSPTCK
jgi:hypothetical protein